MIPKFYTPQWVNNHRYSIQSESEIPKELINKLKSRILALENKQPIVSVIVIAYNEEKTILDCVSSLLHQETKYPYELIVVNNNSTDNTQNILNKIGLTTISETKQGHGHARQAGMMAAKGTYHITADADTIYNKHHVDNMVKTLINKNATAVFGRYSFIPDGDKNRFVLAFYEMFRDIIFSLRAINRPELCVGGASFAYRAEIAKEHGWRTDIRRGEDGSMASALKKKGRLYLNNSYKSRVWSSSRRLDNDGNFFKLVAMRVSKEWKRRKEFMKPQNDKYKDNPDNLR